jgi:GT2 family glycosyltransferase
MPAPVVSVIVPVFNKRVLLRPSLDSIVRAAARCGNVQTIVVDHGSTDGSYELLREYGTMATVMRFNGGTIAAVRNHGARYARGPILSFLDCDCVVPEDYFQTLQAVFAATGAAAVGCECGIPTPAHWTEKVWYELHVVRADGYRHYLNSANFAVRRDAFDEIAGFDERLDVGEDTDICGRLRDAGHRIFETPRLSIVHLDNPKSTQQFFMKEVWRGMAALSGSTAIRRSKATMMIGAHLAAVLAALVLLAWPGSIGAVQRLLWALALGLAVPAATVAYRHLETRRVGNPLPAVALYGVYYCARATALVALTLGFGRRWVRRAS